MYICNQIISQPFNSKSGKKLKKYTGGWFYLILILKKNIMKNFLQKQNYQIIAGQLIAVYFLIQLIFRAQ